jgi:glycosyltransferase involved in cell wall biosynthesis
MRIGIVTISYNQAKYLAEAIESVQVAPPARVDHVIVDAGSADGSREVIEKYRGRFSRIIFEPDRGPPDGLNKGFLATTAGILGYINSDDRFRPGALDYVLRYFDGHPDADVLCGAILVIDEHGRPSIRRRTPDRIDLRRYAYQACFFWQQATFFRREAYLRTAGFNLSSETVWDGELVVDMALAGCRFAYTNKLLGDFRIHRDSITGSGRLREALGRDQARLREKILSAGIPRGLSLEVQAMKMLYKLNPRRHWSYLFGGRELGASP